MYGAPCIGEPPGLPREAEVGRQNVLCSAGHLVTCRPQGGPQRMASQGRVTDIGISPVGYFLPLVARMVENLASVFTDLVDRLGGGQLAT